MRKYPLRLLLFFAGIAFLTGYFSGCALLVRFPSAPDKGDRSPPAERAGDLRPAPFVSERPSVFRGVFHLHTEFSHDSKISLKQVVKEARKAKLDFAVITDHNTLAGKEAYREGDFFPSTQPLRGLAQPFDFARDGEPVEPQAKRVEPPLLIFGTEISTPDGHLIALGLDAMPPPGKSSEDLIQWIQDRGGYSILAHPESSKNPWDHPELEGTSGLEVYNFAHSFYDANKFRLAGQIFLPPKPFLKSFQKHAPFSLGLWDRKLAQSRYAAFGAADAHIHWKFLGLSAESYFLQIRSVTMYVLAEELKTEKVIEALGLGKSFIAFEVFGNAAGFSFTASTTATTVPDTAGTGSVNLSRNVPGTEISGPGDIFTPTGSFVLSVQVPLEANIRLIHRGRILKEGTGNALTHHADERGPYRVEVYKGKDLWIISNPIYVETK